MASPELLTTAKITAQFAEKVRDLLGGSPMHVNSWFRCPAHNVSVGGATNSLHLRGWAVDFTIRGIGPRTVQSRLKSRLRGQEGTQQKFIGGLGCYVGFTHIDRRLDDPGAEWEG